MSSMFHLSIARAVWRPLFSRNFWSAIPGYGTPVPRHSRSKSHRTTIGRERYTSGWASWGGTSLCAGELPDRLPAHESAENESSYQCETKLELQLSRARHRAVVRLSAGIARDQPYL